MAGETPPNGYTPEQAASAADYCGRMADEILLEATELVGLGADRPAALLWTVLECVSTAFSCHAEALRGAGIPRALISEQLRLAADRAIAAAEAQVDEWDRQDREDAGRAGAP